MLPASITRLEGGPPANWRRLSQGTGAAHLPRRLDAHAGQRIAHLLQHPALQGKQRSAWHCAQFCRDPVAAALRARDGGAVGARAAAHPWPVAPTLHVLSVVWVSENRNTQCEQPGTALCVPCPPYLLPGLERGWAGTERMRSDKTLKTRTVGLRLREQAH